MGDVDYLMLKLCVDMFGRFNPMLVSGSTHSSNSPANMVLTEGQEDLYAVQKFFYRLE